MFNKRNPMLSKYWPIIAIFFFSVSLTAEEQSEEKNPPEYWFAKVKQALTTLQFEASVVKVSGAKTESFRWLHGLNQQGLEIESIASLIGGGSQTVRVGNRVTFIEANKQPYSVKAKHIRQFIPGVFYGDFQKLADSYQFVVVSKSAIAGRITQLLRIESIENSAYNYWLWIDVESGLPLRLAFVDSLGEVVQQVLLTHLRVFSGVSEEISKIAQLSLPAPADQVVASKQEMNNWQIAWIPKGFELTKSDRHHLPIHREVADYFQYSDGLVEFSVYIQRPLESFESPIVLKEGATSFVMNRANGFDVTVVGAIPPETALTVARSVTSK